MKKTLLFLPFLLLATSCSGNKDYVESGFYQGTDLPSPWFASAIRAKKQQINIATFNSYLGYHLNRGEPIEEKCREANVRCYPERVFVSGNGNDINTTVLKNHELIDIGNNQKYSIYSEPAGKYSVKLTYKFGFDDSIEIKDIPYEKGYVGYRFCFVDENEEKNEKIFEGMGTDCGWIYYKVNGDTIEFSEDYHFIEK